jgi:hypothetical protein
MSCDKCRKELPIEEHHLWCRYIDNPHGFAFRDFVSRIWLCKEHHTGDFGLHKLILIPILKEYSSKPEYNSEFELWNNIPEELKESVISICVNKSWRWINANS